MMNVNAKIRIATLVLEKLETANLSGCTDRFAPKEKCLKLVRFSIVYIRLKWISQPGRAQIIRWTENEWLEMKIRFTSFVSDF